MKRLTSLVLALLLALTMMVETLGHMAEKNAWFAPLWMQEM